MFRTFEREIKLSFALRQRTGHTNRTLVPKVISMQSHEYRECNAHRYAGRESAQFIRTDEKEQNGFATTRVKNEISF